MRENGTNYDFDQIIGNNNSFVKTIEYAKKIAVKNSSVLIFGETGTGKELFAQSIHNNSSYRNGPFVAVNCAAIPVNLIESVLFGTVSGAFTGAKNISGLLHLANNGSIFLDEINSMNLDSQAKLLRFLQERTIRSVGDNKVQRINCRVISALNNDIEIEIRENRIREDLYYRLSAFTLAIPPLRERQDDILVLSRHFIKKYNLECNTKIEDIDTNLNDAFHKYDWPGNIRELEHVIESAVNMAEEGDYILNESHLSSYLRKKFFFEGMKPLFSNRDFMPARTAEKVDFHKHEKTNETFPLCENDSRSLHDILDDVERKVIIDRLKRCHGNISQTAKDLGIFRQALQYRMKKYNIDDKEL